MKFYNPKTDYFSAPWWDSQGCCSSRCGRGRRSRQRGRGRGWRGGRWRPRWKWGQRRPPRLPRSRGQRRWPRWIRHLQCPISSASPSWSRPPSWKWTWARRRPRWFSRWFRPRPWTSSHPTTVWGVWSAGVAAPTAGERTQIQGKEDLEKEGSSPTCPTHPLLRQDARIDSIPIETTWKISQIAWLQAWAQRNHVCECSQKKFFIYFQVCLSEFIFLHL